MKTYYGEEVIWEVGQVVSHYGDGGEKFRGTITEIDGDTLHIEFFDGEAGWEKSDTCF